MKKILLSVSLLFLLAGCAEVALLGQATTGAANNKVLQSSINASLSYGVKMQTGKSPIEHALNYAEKNNSKKTAIEKKPVKLTNCVPFLEPVSTDMCSVIKNKISKFS